MPSTDDLLHHTLNALAEGRRLPESTYRLQFHAGFTFHDAAEIVGYLSELGLTDCYASPYLTARSGSTHGYDVIDHSRINPELGGEAGLEKWVAALGRHGMSHILDTVPNHVGIATNDNAWWNDVLKHGPASRYADFFDITWRGFEPALYDKVLLPVLGGPYGQVLEKGELTLTSEQGGLVVNYYDRKFPVSNASGSINCAVGQGAASLPSPGTPGEGQGEGLLSPREKDRQIQGAPHPNPLPEYRAREHTGDICLLNGTPGDPHSFDALDALLNQQFYRLAYWRTASDEINYRRFFDISDLAALRQEREDVFLATHSLTLRLLAQGRVIGLRIDHPDGLLDPEQYFRRLQRHYVLACASAAFDADPRNSRKRWSDVEPALCERLDAMMLAAPQSGLPLYVVAEKILATDELLCPHWPIHGTSGYDFLNKINGLFIDSDNRDRLTDIYERFTGCKASFTKVTYEKKKLILNTSLASELHMLAFILDRLAQKDRHSRDFTLSGLHQALLEMIACFPVYRSYISHGGVLDADRPRIESAVADAIRRNPSIDPVVFHFIRDTLLLRYPDANTNVHSDEQVEFAGKFQQLTAPVTAKGVEDTAFYVYNRLLSLNEVGGDPDRFGVSVDALHAYLGERQARWPCALSALTTHDTKRSEDARARIDVLSEIADEWERCVERWSTLNERHRSAVGSIMAPDRNEEYMLYQSLVGAWPLEQRRLPLSPSPGTPGEGWGEGLSIIDRIQQYLQKALREAKVHTTWTEPNAAYEDAVARFVARILDRELSGDFLADLETLMARVSQWGMLNSLAQTLLRLTAPGVPDTYQGTELWDFSLVDPDNRRPVDYHLRRHLLDSLHAQTRASESDRRPLVQELVTHWQDGRVKLYVTELALKCRRQHPGLFTQGEYLPLLASGPHRDNVFAFARRMGEKMAVVVVPRLITRLLPAGQLLPLGEAVWQGTQCSVPDIDMDATLRNVFTGKLIEWRIAGGAVSLRMASALEDFPIALFV